MDINFLLNDYRLKEGDKFQNKKKQAKVKKPGDIKQEPTERESREIVYSNKFRSSFESNVPINLKDEVKANLEIILKVLENKEEFNLPKSPYNFHALTGGGHSFRVSNSLVVTLLLWDNLVVLEEIGTHSQIKGYYGKEGKSMNLDSKRSAYYKMYGPKDKE